MDIFKLLTRSTNLQKTQLAKHGATLEVPSASGAPAVNGSESSHAWILDGQKSTSRGTKRKRNPVVMSQRAEIAQEPDFLGDDGTAAGSQSRHRSGFREIQERDSPVDGAHEEPGFLKGVLSEVDCRRSLKRHKLKITILRDSSQSQSKQKKSNGVHSERGEKTKPEAHAQLIPQPLTSFDQLLPRYGISRRLAENLDAQGYQEPTGVQLGGLPLLLGSDEERGLLRHFPKHKKPQRADLDLLTVAPTGSGKTLAFLIPTLQGLLEERKQRKEDSTPGPKEQHGVRALIIAPTHELADQIVNEGRKLALKTGIKVSAMRKGMRLHPDLIDHPTNSKTGGKISDQEGQEQVRQDFLVKADVLVSTPLLLLHAISSDSQAIPKPLPSVHYLVLDEADVLLDLLFRDQTLGIWHACCAPCLRTSLWSATIGSSIESLAQTFILDRRKDLGIEESSALHYILRLVVGLKDSAIPNISHRLVYAASEQGKLLGFRQLLHPAATPSASAPSLQPPFLVFTQTIQRAIALHSELLYDVPPEAGGSSRIAVLHSDLSETARSKIMAGFRKGETWILITTDLLSRGMDFRGMNGVVNYDIPNTGSSYVHRVGRTGRQGREGGIAVTLYTKEDIPYLRNIANVVAASEKAKGMSSNEIASKQERTQQWLLDSLPEVSKKAKKDLKFRGVESRRVNPDGIDPRKLKKMRISTKSGYDRRLENKKKGAARHGQGEVNEGDHGSSDAGDWEGFDI